MSLMLAACYSDPSMYKRVEKALVNLMMRVKEAVDSLPRQKRRQYYDAFHSIWKEAKTLYDQLYTWGEDEEICYDEYWARIRILEERLRRLEEHVARRY